MLPLFSPGNHYPTPSYNIPAAASAASTDDQAHLALQQKAAQCKILKDELLKEFKRNRESELSDLILERSEEFTALMVYSEEWQNIDNRGKTILEVAIEEVNYTFDTPFLKFAFKTIAKSEPNISQGISYLHLLVRNARSSPIMKTFLVNQAKIYPQQLTKVAKIMKLEVTPVELAIRFLNDKQTIFQMVDRYTAHTGVLTTSEKAKLLIHAQCLAESHQNFYVIVGKELIAKINKLPEILE